MGFDDVPWVVGVVGTDVALGTAVVGQFFGHDKLAVGKSLVVADHAWLLIVIAHHVGHTGKLVLVVVLAGQTHGTGRFVLMHKVLQHLGALHSLVGVEPCLGQFVADAPSGDAGVVAVAFQHAEQVALPPLVEVVLVVARLPLVESLVDDDEAHLVAEVEKFGRRRIVGAADGVHPIRPEEFESSFHRTSGQGRAKTGIILMQAEALQFQRLSVQQETSVGCELHGADAEGCLHLVEQTATVVEACDRLVEVRVSHAIPQVRVGDADGGVALAPCHHPAIGIENLVLNPQLGRCAHHGGAERHLTALSGEVDAVGGNVDGVALHQPCVAVDATPRVPSGNGVVVGRVVHPHIQFIRPPIVQVGREVILYLHKAIGTETEVVAVDEDIATVVDAIKNHAHRLATVGGREGERLSVFAQSPSQVAIAARQSGVGNHVDAPVVRQADLFPTSDGLLQSWPSLLFCPLLHREVESPAIVKTLGDAWILLCRPVQGDEPHPQQDKIDSFHVVLLFLRYKDKEWKTHLQEK